MSGTVVSSSHVKSLAQFKIITVALERLSTLKTTGEIEKRHHRELMAVIVALAQM
jgi:hypothetical protein